MKLFYWDVTDREMKRQRTTVIDIMEGSLYKGTERDIQQSGGTFPDHIFGPVTRQTTINQ